MCSKEKLSLQFCCFIKTIYDLAQKTFHKLGALDY